MRIVVIGGGPGGYSAAFEAARLGAEVTLVEKELLGGTCLNWGCVPTKTILRSARIAHDAAHASEYGLRLGEAQVDLEALLDRKESIVQGLREQLEATAKRLKVDIVVGGGRIQGPGLVRVTSDERHIDYETDAIILATGSCTAMLPFIDHSLERVWTSDEAVSLVDLPQSVLIVGAGVIGLEFACIYASFGSDVHVVELTPSVLPGNDKRVQRAAQASLEAMGVHFYLGTKTTAVVQDGDVVRTALDSGEEIETDYLLSAVGRTPNTSGLGLEDAGVEMDRAAVKVDDYFRTNLDGVYAIGDLIGGMMLAHVADEEGVTAARNAIREWAFARSDGMLQRMSHLPHLESVDYCCVPACVYTFPEIGVVGHSRDAAKEVGLEVVVAVAKMTANGKALGEGEADGFVQMVAERGTGRILGCQIVGPHAVETIHEVALAMRHRLSVSDISEVVHAHPTISEVIKAAALDAEAKAGE